MKKILSAVLAAAMVLSMGVMAFASTDYGFGTGATQNITVTNGVSDTDFGIVFVERNGSIVNQKNANTTDNIDLAAGDILYFTVHQNSTAVTFAAPENWRIRINNADFVADADFYNIKANDILDKYLNNNGASVGTLMVKVELEDDFDHYDEDEVKFYFYIYDTKNKTESTRARVSYDFEGYKTVNLKAADLDWVISVDIPTTFKYDKKAKAKEATLDFKDGTALVGLKMFPGESYKVSGVQKYQKDLSKEYDTDVSTIDLRGIDGGDLVLTASKDNKQVVMVVDGELVPVDAEYVKGYKFDSGETTTGYLVENAEEGLYALISANIELDVDEDFDLDDDTTSAPVEDNKVNPPMGANDFVGAAVALAVVSVAAAGALALKK